MKKLAFHVVMVTLIALCAWDAWWITSKYLGGKWMMSFSDYLILIVYPLVVGYLLYRAWRQGYEG